VSVFYDRQDELEKYEFMMGEARGRLAVTLDVLTDALILVGQHGVYCASARTRRSRRSIYRLCWRTLPERRSWWHR
jgi:hypothetical protein